jgi:rhodanese-related sulfurtransferase
MIKRLLTTLLFLQLSLLADFQGVDAQTMLSLHKSGSPIIDIRTPSEWKETGVVKDSHKIMFFDESGGYDVPKFLDLLSKVVKGKEQPFILVCRTASRTKVVGQFLSKEVGYKHVKELTGGVTFSGVKLVK